MASVIAARLSGVSPELLAQAKFLRMIRLPGSEHNRPSIGGIKPMAAVANHMLAVGWGPGIGIDFLQAFEFRSGLGDWKDLIR